MADSDDLKSQALNSSDDFYALLEIQEGAQETEIRRAYRKTALKYHPDKVGADQKLLDKFHLLSVAYEVLSTPTTRELYDNARRAKQAKAERDQQLEGRRKAMKDDLEMRESGAFKRKREDRDAEEEFERELRRIAEDGKKRRKEMEETLRREAEEIEREEKQAREGDTNGAAINGSEGSQTRDVSDLDRSITLRFRPNEETKHIDEHELVQNFERFGPIESVVLLDKKVKVDGEKHRQPYKTAIIVYQSIVGAHAVVSDFPKVRDSSVHTYGIFEAVGWAGGKEPHFIPKTTSAAAASPKQRFDPDTATPELPTQNGETTDGKKAPSFGSFKTTSDGQSRPSLDEMTMMRLKNAERKRMEDKIRREEAVVQAQHDEATGAS